MNRLLLSLSRTVVPRYGVPVGGHLERWRGGHDLAMSPYGTGENAPLAHDGGQQQSFDTASVLPESRQSENKGLGSSGKAVPVAKIIGGDFLGAVREAARSPPHSPCRSRQRSFPSFSVPNSRARIRLLLKVEHYFQPIYFF